MRNSEVFPSTSCIEVKRSVELGYAEEDLPSLDPE